MVQSVQLINQQMTSMRNKVRHILLITTLVFLISSNASAWDLNLADKPLPYLAPESVFNIQGSPISLKKYRGKKVMLWLFSTWCHTCVVAAKSLEKHNTELQQNGLTVLAIRNYKNGGNPGLNIEQFMGEFAPSLLKANNWVLGEATAQLDNRYNAKHYADVYFLIDEQGIIQVVSTSPAATLPTIKQFLKGKPHE